MIPIEFLRQFRLGGYAIFDFIVSFLGMFLLSPILSKLFSLIKVKIPKLNWVILTLPLSIIAHLASGRITPMTKNFLDLNDHYILKMIILVSIILGVRNIKIDKN